MYLGLLNKPLFRWLMGYQGVADRTKITNAEIDAYLDLLRRDDNGRAFLKIMRGFELTREKADLYVGVLRSTRYPVRIVGGRPTPHSRSTSAVNRPVRPPDSTRSTDSRASTSYRRTRLRPWPMKSSRPHEADIGPLSELSTVRT